MSDSKEHIFIIALRAVYDVHVYTSDVKNAGTDAGVLIEILGDRASSGKQPLLDM